MERISGEDDYPHTEEQIHLVSIKERAIVLAEKINQYCSAFRSRLRNCQIVGYEDVLAKLYYDLALLNCEYYWQNDFRDNLLLIKLCLERSLEQSPGKESDIAQQTKYFLDSVCDLYSKSDLQESQLPSIPGNAVVLVRGESSKDYHAYFVEDGHWIRNGQQLKIVRIRKPDLENIDFDQSSGFAWKTPENREEIEKITRNAQLQRGQASINIKYYALKRKRKGLEKRLVESVSPAVMHELLSELIECNLQIGFDEEANYYINLLRISAGERFREKLNEYKLRKELIVSIRQIADGETALLSAPPNDVQSVVVKKPSNDDEYERELKTWKRIQCVEESSSILFLCQAQVEEHPWRSYFWLPNQEPEHFPLQIDENSSLGHFLTCISAEGMRNSFVVDVLDMLTGENVFLQSGRVVNLKGKRTKMMELCDQLSEAYDSVGHYPLEERYRQAFSYCFKEKQKCMSLSSSNAQSPPSDQSEEQSNPFPQRLFPIDSGSIVKNLNDCVTEKDFFSNILPYVDQISRLKRSLNPVYEIDWRVCLNEGEKDQHLTSWQAKNEKLKEKKPFEKKHLLLFIPCRFYFISNLDLNHLPKVNGNALVLTSVPESTDYDVYFVKDSLWLKDARLGQYKTLLIKNIPLAANENSFFQIERTPDLEKLAGEMSLHRWYFAGETLLERLSMGFVDQKRELRDLQPILQKISSTDLRELKSDAFRKKESEILNHLSEVFLETHSNDAEIFIRSISSPIDIPIYDLRKSEDEKRLKDAIRSDRSKNFTSIVRLSTKHYITLFVESEKEDSLRRYIYILNSSAREYPPKKLQWFAGVHKQCVYKLRFIPCPKERSMTEDSFLHSYFNARACQWAAENAHWQFLMNNFLRQEFSSQENIERMKQWLVESSEKVPIPEQSDEQMSHSENVQLIADFRNLFSDMLHCHLQNLESERLVNDLTQNFAKIRTFAGIVSCLRQMNVPETEERCGDILTKLQTGSGGYSQVEIIVDVMFLTLKEYSSNLLAWKEKLAKHLETLEHRLHHALLVTMIDKKYSSIYRGKYPDCAKRLQPFFASPSANYEQFLGHLETFLREETNFSDRENLLSLCRKIREVLCEDGRGDEVLSQRTFANISSFVKYFAKVESNLESLDRLFTRLLYQSYEPLELAKINSQLKSDLYSPLGDSKTNLEETKNILLRLLEKIQPRPDDYESNKKSLEEMFKLFNQSIEKGDERAVHYLRTALLEMLFNRIDLYMKSLTSFRHQTLVSMEDFQKQLHQFLLHSIKESIRNQTDTSQIATKAKQLYDVSKGNARDYPSKLRLYRELVDFCTKNQDFIPVDIIRAVQSQLESNTHSHIVYLEKKTEDLTRMLDRFAGVENILKNFSQLFGACLRKRYEHLAGQSVFSTDGQIKREIFYRLKQKKSFEDIKTLLAIFADQRLNEIMGKCEIFERERDDRGSVEISECLRQAILQTTERYVSDLLTFRHTALVTFNQFEREFHQFLSTYSAIQDEGLRSFLRQRWKKLARLPDYLTDEDFYQRALPIYKEVIKCSNGDYARTLKNILEQPSHSLVMYFRERTNNLKNLLSSYVEWYEIKTDRQDDYVIFEMRTTSAVLSEVLKVLREKQPDCFCANNEIRIVNSNKVYLDVDLTTPEYSGVNVVLISPEQELVKEKAEFLIKTNGENAKEVWETQPAKSGLGVDANRNGNKGENGSDGKAGKGAGHVYVVGTQLPSIKVSACGGKGGRGQDGGNGANGLSGADGAHADKQAMIKDVERAWALVSGAWAHRRRRIGTDGQAGGCGGDAGSGGYRGDGGQAGLVKVIGLNDVSRTILSQKSPGKAGERDGNVGKAGEAGLHGKDGLDYVVISNTQNFFRATVTSRKIDAVKGGRLRSDHRRRLNEKKRRHRYPMLPFDYDEDKDRFKKKYSNETAQRGATSEVKHHNQEAVQTIHAIDRRNVFEETCHFFNHFNNPQKLSYQHWLAPNLNQFLQKMAALEGLPSFKVNALPDIDQEAREILILREQFTQLIGRENERLKAERISTDQMSIGMVLLSEEILTQRNEFVQQYQTVYQQFHNQTEQVDVHQLATGLETRSVEMAQLRSTIDRMINERQANQRLAAAQRRTEVLEDQSKEELSKTILERQNITILKEDPFSPQWREFLTENILLDSPIVVQFNESPCEETLLEAGRQFLLKLEERTDCNEQISNFTSTFLHNLQQGSFNFQGCEYISRLKDVFDQILLLFQSLEKTPTLDLLIDFSQGMQREHLRHRWLLWIKKTVENRGEPNEHLSELFDVLRGANSDQIDQLNEKLRFTLVLKAIPSYGFEKELYKDHRSKLIASVDQFHEETNPENLVKIFRIFSDSPFFEQAPSQLFEDLLIHPKQLDFIHDFLFTFQHNLSLMDLKEDTIETLATHMIKIEEILVRYPRSYFSDLLFYFAMIIEKMRKREVSAEIRQSKDLHQLLTLQKPNCVYPTVFTVEQRINAFHSLHEPNLVKEIFADLPPRFPSIEKKTWLEFVRWITKNFDRFSEETVGDILHSLGTILRGTIHEDLRFLRTVLRYQKAKLECERQKEQIESKSNQTEEFLTNFLSVMKRCNILFKKTQETTKDRDEIAYELYESLNELIELAATRDLLGCSPEKFDEIERTSNELNASLSNPQTLKNFKELKKQIPPEYDQVKKDLEGFIDHFHDMCNAFKEHIDYIRQQREYERNLHGNEISLKVLEELFADIDKIDEDMRCFLNSSLERANLTKQKENEFCLFVQKSREKLEEKVKNYLKEHQSSNRAFEKKLKKLFNDVQNDGNADDLTSSFLETLNLCQSHSKEDLLSKTLQDSPSTQIFSDILSSYPIFNTKLYSVKPHLKKIPPNANHHREILQFLRQESQTKSQYVEEIYEKFFQYCDGHLSDSSLESTQTQFLHVIHLMEVIGRAHEDSLYPIDKNLDHARFQVILLHTLFCRDLVQMTDEQLVDFLSWLFRFLSDSRSTKIEIETRQIRGLERLEQELSKKESTDTSEIYKVLNRSMASISLGIRELFVQSNIRDLFRENPTAKWLEVLIYFPSNFALDITDISNLLITDQQGLIDKIEQIISKRISLLQQEKLETFSQLIHTDDAKLKDQLRKGFEDLNGYLRENLAEKKRIPYHILNFNHLIDVFNEKIGTDGRLFIPLEIFLKLQQCLACFEDFYPVIEKFSSSSQTAWLQIALIEHVIEKVSLIFPSQKNQSENLRNLLLRTEKDLVFLLNNVFFTEHFDQIYPSATSLADYRKISEEKFLAVLHLLTKVPVSKQLLAQLNEASLAVWDTILHEIEFSQIFYREMSERNVELGNDDAEKILLYFNRIRIQLGIEQNEEFRRFFQMIVQKIERIDQLNALLTAVHYQHITFEQAKGIVSKFSVDCWTGKVDEMKKAQYKSVDEADRSARDLIEEIIGEQNWKINIISEEILWQVAKQADTFRELAKEKVVPKKNVAPKGNDKSEIDREILEILNDKSYQAHPNEYVRSHLEKVIPLILYTWSVANQPQFPKDTQIIALLLFIHSHDRGLLEQVRTGEGKTLIVGMAAAFFALCGDAVDIVSSNRDLAIEGEKKCRAFFQLLKIESGHICSDDEDVNQLAYRADLSTPHGNVVYGEVGAFQRDILEAEFNNKDIFGKRYANRQKCLIVDEVDSMCLDKARHVLYLSHEIQSLKWLETLFLFIWSTVLRQEIEHPDEIPSYSQNIASFIKQSITNKNIFVPEYLKEYTHYKIERWIDSAFQARMMREDDHFVLDVSKSDQLKNSKQKNIIVVDKDTGVEQYSTRWSHGLAQFLELKYRRKLTVESLKAVFISNKTFFQRYKDRLYGLTGTLGSENSQSFLADLYHVRFILLPTSRKKSFHQQPSRVALEYGDWLEFVAKESIEQAKRRPVLIICENVEVTENVWEELTRHNVSPHKIEKYRRDGDDVEERFRKKPATLGDIIIATNKGGRGTDIHVDERVNKDGGMHVILTYLPENIRVEEQAFGRTSRNGALGSGQYILHVDKSICDEMYHLNDYPLDQQKKKLDDFADAIIEREKITRDNKEAARLSDLKKKNILHLEVEEELLEQFNRFKSKISDTIFRPLFNDKSDKFKVEFVQAFEHILKNRWAFWLDRAKDRIDAIKTSQEKKKLLDEFRTDSETTFHDSLEKISSFQQLVTNFLSHPEEAIYIGKVCVAEKDFANAKHCFQRGVECGDVSGFSSIALAFCIINLPGPEDAKKRESRRVLKKAIDSLEAFKRTLMSNLKIAEYLPQLATSEISKKVSSQENFYQDQVRGKLEVIGLHLHHLKQAVGDMVEPFDFILHPADEKNITEEDCQKGQKLYDLLVDKKLIQGNTLRRIFRKNSSEREKMEQTIRENLDPSIAEEVICLLRSNREYKKKDFEKIVCSNDELWASFNFQNIESVAILNTDRIGRELPAAHEKAWKELKEEIDPDNVMLSLFEQSEERRSLRKFLEEKKILSETKRVRIEELERKIASLQFQDEYEKYSRVKFNDHGDEEKNLLAFLRELIVEVQREGREYLYQVNLPFATREEEGKKIEMFLKEKNFLKSGGLAKHNYGDSREQIENLLKVILEETGFQNDQKEILSTILSLQGTIRASTDPLKAALKDFIELPEQDIVPPELSFFEGFGLNKFLIIQEDKSWWDWRAFAVAMIGLAQVIGGALLISIGLVNVGAALISEGISDMVYGTMAGLSGTFSWRDWAIQKAISLSISIFTLGIGKLASVGKTVAKVGSVSRTAMFAKIVGKTAVQFARTCLVNFFTEKIIALVQESVIEKVVQSIEENLLGSLSNLIQNKVQVLYANSSDDRQFEKLFEDLKKLIDDSLKGKLFSPQIGQIRLQVVSCLKDNYRVLADSLSKSSSQYAKLASNAMKAAVIADKVWNLLQTTLHLKEIYNAVKNLIKTVGQTSASGRANRANPTLVAARAQKLNEIIREYIKNELSKELEKHLRQLIHETLTRVGKAVAQGAKALIDSQFNGKNPLEIMKRSNANQRNSVVAEQPFPTENSKKDQQKREDLQTTIQNPKKSFDKSSEEMQERSSALGLPDLKILADMEQRNTVVHNLSTGEKVVAGPEGLGGFFAFFKQTAETNYQARDDGQPGHYSNARGEQRYQQLEGCHNCAIVAFYESAGETVNEDFIRQKREELDKYKLQNSERYQKYQEEILRSRRDQMIGGRRPETTTNPREIPQASNPQRIYIDDPDIRPEETTKERRNRPADPQSIRKEITDELWPKAFDVLSDKAGRVDVGFRQRNTNTIYATENVRFDDQGTTGDRHLLHFATQLGGSKLHYQRASSKEKTNFAEVLVERPSDSSTIYSYRKEDLLKAHQMSMEQGVPMRMGPKKSSDRKNQQPTENSKQNAKHKKK